MNINVIKEHLTSGAVGRSVVALQDMHGPVDLNACATFIAKRLNIDAAWCGVDCTCDTKLQEYRIAKLIHDYLDERGHTAFAFYCFASAVDGDVQLRCTKKTQYIRFGSTDQIFTMADLQPRTNNSFDPAEHLFNKCEACL